jgi:hypothetical protein
VHGGLNTAHLRTASGLRSATLSPGVRKNTARGPEPCSLLIAVAARFSLDGITDPRGHPGGAES